MKKIFSILFAATILLAACEKHKTAVTTNSDGTVERTVIYSVGKTENRSTMETDAEWDALLDQFLVQSKNGNEVVFYNLNLTTYGGNDNSDAKDSRTITTSNREEIKAWMKQMEKEGLTVRVTYDDGTGTWNGVAYATAPSSNTSGMILGTWRLTTMIVVQNDDNEVVQNIDYFEPIEGGNMMYYIFNSDGTILLNVNNADSVVATGNSTWTLSDNGILCSDLLPSGECWNVNWISSNTMILSHSDNDTPDGDLIYQLQFEAVATEK